MKTLLSLFLTTLLISSAHATSPILPEEKIATETLKLVQSPKGPPTGCYYYSKITIGQGGFLGNVALLSSGFQGVKYDPNVDKLEDVAVCPAIYIEPEADLYKINKVYTTTPTCAPVTYEGQLITTRNSSYDEQKIVIKDYRNMSCATNIPAQVVITLEGEETTRNLYYNSDW